VLRYRFFLPAARKCRDARACATVHFAENVAVAIAPSRLRAPGGVLEFAGGHARPAEIHASGRLLLPLLQSEEPGKLREDVRAAEIRVALVGDVLLKAAKPLQRSHSGRRAAFAAQGSRRARTAVSKLQKIPA